VDLGTELAIRAVVCGLYNSEAISADQVRGVIGALKEAAGTAMDRQEPDAAKELVKLCKGIRIDTAVTTGAPHLVDS
jgi:hypothetical protein